jgi:hypothetical protein
MIVLPAGFVSTRYPGYFWNIPEQKLYTAKGGVLKKMYFSKGYNNHPPGYKVSHLGYRKTMSLEYLQYLKYPTKVEIFPMKVD